MIIYKNCIFDYIKEPYSIIIIVNKKIMNYIYNNNKIKNKFK